MIEIPPIFDSFKEKQVPTFVVSRFNRFETIFLVSFYLFCLIYGWYVFTHELRAEKFLIYLVVPLALLLIKNRMYFISLLIAAQFIIAFWCIGNAEDVVIYTGAIILILFALSSLDRGYGILILSLFLFFSPTIQGYEVVHVVGFILIVLLLINREEIVENEINRKHPYNRIMFVMFVYVTLSLAWSQDFFAISATYYDTFTIFVAYWLTIVLVNSEERLFRSLKIWVYAGFIYAVARSLYQPDTGTDPNQQQFFYAKNTISSLINFSIFALLPAITMKTKRIPMTLVYVCVAILLVVNIGIGSKAGFLGLAIGMLTYFLIVPGKKERRYKAFFLKVSTAFIILFLIAQIFLVPLLYMKLHFLALPMSIPTEFGTILFRFEQWDYGKQMLEQNGNYILGLGMNGYSFLYGSFYESETPPAPWQNHPHSIYVHVYCDYGIIGFLIFTILIIGIILVLHRFLLRSKNVPLKVVAASFYGAIFAFLIHALVDWALMEIRFWMFVAMSIAITLIDRRQEYKAVPFPKSRDQSPY